MSVSTNLRTDISKMYEYKETITLPKLDTPDNVDVVLDNIPTKYPYLPRLCDKQGIVLVWWGTKDTDPEIYEDAVNSKDEEQWITLGDNKKLIKGLAMVHTYEKEVIVSCIKYAGYMNRKPWKEVLSFLENIYSTLVKLYGNNKMIIPSGSYLEHIHLTMNQMKIQRQPYHYKNMKRYGFRKQEDYWVRNGTEI